MSSQNLPTPNARLIAAAPDLLEAATVALSVISQLNPSPEYTHRLLVSAIAKAIGNQEKGRQG